VKSAAKANGEVSKAELSALNREYLAARNRAQQAKAESAEILLAEKKGTLISRKLAGFQLGYLLTAFRQRTLAAPVNIAGRLAALGLVDAAKEHSTAEAIKEDVYALLEDLADLPDQVTDPDWLQKIDGDLLEQVEGTPERGQTPVQAKGAAEQAKIRREKKNAAQRRRRAEGRVKG
jgi:hypothetical protein